MRRLVFAATVTLGAMLAAACGSKRDLSGSEGADSGLGFDPGDGGAGVDTFGTVDLEAGPPYAVLGVKPSHGPFNGGTRVEIRGRGFTSKTRVRFGTIDVPAGDVVAVDPYHVQVVTPAGEPGPVDVSLVDEPSSQSAVLPAGFTYDGFYADPDTGATSGGTLVTLVGRATGWTDGTTATIDGKPCGDLRVVDATHITCVAPAGTPGTKSVTVTTPDKVVSSVRDAYTYADTSDGYRGGLAGDKLPGELKILALANPNGDLVGDATVVVRGSDGTEQTAKTTLSGVASFGSPPPAPLTVTVAKKCLTPVTFDGVKVRSVTVYMNPVVSTACIPPDGEPPPTGGKSRDLGIITGELVFPDGIEFKRAPWKGVPSPKKTTQRVAAYVWAAGRDNLSRFYLPDPTQATTQDSPGTVGYDFQLTTLPGNQTIYAIAGIEDRPTDGKPATFDPYVYGVVRGVGVPIGGVIDRVLVPMEGTFTHEVRHTVSGIPITPRGPDRIDTTVAVDLGEGFMILPNGVRHDLLPYSGELPFVGVPPLTGALATSSYITAVEAVTGGSGGVPSSSVLKNRFRIAGTVVPITNFLPLPKFVSPAVAAPWDGTTVKLDLPAGVADLIIVQVSSGDGSTSWLVVAPGDARTVNLPDFSAHPELGMPGGELAISATAAKVSDFSYDTVRYGQLSRSAWTAYSYDTAFGYW